MVLSGGVTLALVDQHFPAFFHAWGLRRGLGESFHAGPLVARPHVSLIGALISPQRSPCSRLRDCASPAGSVLGGLVGGCAWASSPRPGRVLLQVDLNVQICVARTGRDSHSWKAVRVFPPPAGRLWPGVSDRARYGVLCHMFQFSRLG